jgi:thymidylate synthase ThyX
MSNKVSPFVLVVDDIGPEPNAMLQALYSRSPRSVEEHLNEVKERGAEKFMSQYYVGYGHKSIGDCGTTTVFIENVSMLVAKAVQDWPLYSGQEASTRYLDMSKQPIVDPIGNNLSREILSEWMRVYQHTIKTLVPHIEGQFPLETGPGDDEKEVAKKTSVYKKAVLARAFDIARGLLPAGITTFVSWHTNLRQAHDHLKRMEHHPLDEVREVAVRVRGKLRDKYPSSFGYKMDEKQEQYLSLVSPMAYFDDMAISSFRGESHIRLKELLRSASVNQTALYNRPAKTELPQEFRRFGDFVFRFLLDFGSFRDVQRQRSMVCPMPLLTTRHGFHPWYLKQLPEGLREEVAGVIENQRTLIDSLECPDEVKQYYIAMGYMVTCDTSMSLPAAVYIAELRTMQTVHPTLREIAQQIGGFVEKSIPGIAMHHDMSPDTWSTKRGTQDIVKKS